MTYGLAVISQAHCCELLTLLTTLGLISDLQ